MGKLQIIIIGVSVILAIVALLLFAGIIPGFRAGQPGQVGEISLWGTIPQKLLAPALGDFRLRFKNITVTYREFKPETYIDELVNALASNRGPDIFLLPQEQILKQKDKVFILTSEIYPLRVFRDNFLDLAGIYETNEGIVGIPLRVDPLVLYWNRDLFGQAAIAKPPATWDEFSDTTQKLTKREGGKILQSGAALGEFRNIQNAKDILALLMLQTGSAIVDPQTLKPVFAERDQNILSPAEEALLLFNSFSDSRKDTYSWNRTLPEAREAFSSGRLAMYIGYASDLDPIIAQNPHLNFDVREVPQIRDGKFNVTFAKSTALVVSKQSPNIATALTLIYDLTGFSQQKLLAENSLVPPALRSLLAQTPENPILVNFYRAAIRSRAWLDPNPVQTRLIWQEMVESVLSGAKKMDEAVRSAQAQFRAFIPKTN